MIDDDPKVIGVGDVIPVVAGGLDTCIGERAGVFAQRACEVSNAQWIEELMTTSRTYSEVFNGNPRRAPDGPMGAAFPIT